MKKKYMKPEMQTFEISKMSLLVGSGKGVYGQVKGGSDPSQVLDYGGYVNPDEEDQFDPD